MSFTRTKKFTSPQTIVWTSGGRSVLAAGLEQELPVAAILLELRGRLGITGGTTNGTFYAEAIQNLIRRVVIKAARNDGKGSITFYDVRGAELFASRVFRNRRWPRFQGITRLGAAGIANYDFLMSFRLPLVAEGVGIVDFFRTLVDPSRFSSWNMEVQFGTTAEMVSGGDRVLALTDFGSAAGSPTISYILERPILAGESFGTHYMSRVSRQTNLSNLGNVTRQFLVGAGDFPTGNIVKSVQIRQYQQAAVNEGVVDQSAGAALFLGIPTAVLAGITRIYIMRNSSIADHEYRWNQLADNNSELFGMASNRPSITTIDDSGLITGYGLVDFTAESGSLDDGYDLRVGFPPARLQLYVDSATVPANSQVDVMVEQVVEY